MVYCNLVKTTKDGAIYAYGGDCIDFSGRLEIVPKNCEFNILKEPINSHVALRHITYMCMAYRDKFAANIFPQRISREI